ncbi:MAG TPA: hypothetical protein VFV52_01095 [Bacilli bacterium]|nr:hypothetical protein [Bacilli bacterium]
MKKTYAYLTVPILCGFLLATGCSDQQATPSDTDTPKQQTDPVTQEPAKTTESTQDATEDLTDDELQTDKEKVVEHPNVTAEFYKTNIHVGQTQEEVQQLLGTPNAEVAYAQDGHLIWRYDYPTDPDYVFVSSPGTEMIAVWDGDGMKNGKLRMQTMVGWTKEGTVKELEVVYKQDRTTQVYKIP